MQAQTPRWKTNTTIMNQPRRRRWRKTISMTFQINYLRNLYSVPIKLATEGTSLTDKDCSMVDSNGSSQNNMLSSSPNSS
ncbi:hypothetical protein KY289_000849 [Solanum tuberosum]|nr:hypothetical protein KY289_000849 [Solanum tuberosum]